MLVLLLLVVRMRYTSLAIPRQLLVDRLRCIAVSFRGLLRNFGFATLVLEISDSRVVISDSLLLGLGERLSFLVQLLTVICEGSRRLT